MVKPFALSTEPAREGRLFCPVAGCKHGYSGWVGCTRGDCPKDVAALVERGAATEGRHGS